MAGEVNLAALNGNFKEVYADNIRDLLPSAVKLQKTIKFVGRSKEAGGLYHQPVVLAYEHGVTFNNPSINDAAFALNSAVAGQTKDATVGSVEMVLRSRLSYAAASRGSKGRNAFVDSTELLVRNMHNSVAKKLEVQLMYGGSGLAKVGSISGNVITVPPAEWASGIWTGAEGMFVSVFSADGATQRAGTNLFADGKSFKIVSVNIGAKTITLDSAGSGTNGVITANDVIYYAGARTVAGSNEMQGLHSILSATTGPLFGIPLNTYAMWQGNQYNVTSTSKAMSFNIIAAAVDQAISKGLDEDVTVLMSTKAFTDLQADNDQKRQIDFSYSKDKTTRGSKDIGFITGGLNVKFVPSTFVKEGYAYIVIDSDWLRIGSTDVTFNRPGQSDSFFLDLQENAGYELRCYSDQALFCEAPVRQVLITGLVSGL